MAQQALAKQETSAERLEALLALIEKKAPEEGKEIRSHLEAVRGKDIVVLGTDEAFALRDADGEIRAFKQQLFLSIADGTLVQPIPGGPYVVSAQGYERWAEAVGASVIFPKEVLVDGDWQQNPAVIRDQGNRRILAIYARAVAFRFTSKGIPQVTDWTTIFDTPSYRLIDLLGKAKKFPHAFRLYPSGLEVPKDEGTWANYPFDESTVLWVNTSHDEALAWYAQILNREKKAIDFAQTFARRNALKHLSGIQKAPGAQWRLGVLSWRPTSGNIIKWDATQYIQLQEKAGRLITARGEDFAPGHANAPKRMITRAGKERSSDENGFESLEAEVDPEDQSTEAEENAPQSTESNASPEPAPETPEEDDVDLDAARPQGQADLFAGKDETLAVFKQLAAAKKKVPEIYGEALTRLGLSDEIENPKTAAKVLQLMNQIADEE